MKVKVYFKCSDCGERTQSPYELDNGKIICLICDAKRLINTKPIVMNTQENIKMIAEFMEDYDFEHTEGGLPIGDFSNSWEWLMPVVDKIDLILPDDSFVIISFNRCLIEWVNVEGLGNTRREATYKAVVEFINEYNKNK